MNKTYYGTITSPFSDSKFSGQKEIWDVVSSILLAVLLCVLLFVFVIVPSEVEGKSMEPSFTTGDRLYTSRLSYWLGDTDLGRSLGLDYSRGDVIVVNPPLEGKSLIKRIVGMPGDRLKIMDGHVYINGKILEEKYLPAGTNTELSMNSVIKEGQEIVVSCDVPPTVGADQKGEDCYFALGDNRYNSYDSRSIGLIRRSWIQGKVILRIWPLDKFSTISSGISE